MKCRDANVETAITRDVEEESAERACKEGYKTKLKV